MDIFNILTMLGGLALFLFGMSLMGQALERRAGSSLRQMCIRDRFTKEYRHTGFRQPKLN